VYVSDQRIFIVFVTDFPVVDNTLLTFEVHFVTLVDHLNTVLGVADQVQKFVRKDVALLHSFNQLLLLQLLVFVLLTYIFLWLLFSSLSLSICRVRL
jgi:hypothetical protein